MVPMHNKLISFFFKVCCKQGDKERAFSLVIRFLNGDNHHCCSTFGDGGWERVCRNSLINYWVSYIWIETKGICKIFLNLQVQLMVLVPIYLGSSCHFIWKITMGNILINIWELLSETVNVYSEYKWDEFERNLIARPGERSLPQNS